jgi:hypothetical protein|tara:strand:+ start:471 stop:650 length:180 start_codon:yes stop_codon:yes gene_type:complete
MKISYEEVKKLKFFYGVKLKGNETFDELLKIEKDNRERIKKENASIERIDAQTKSVKKW